MTEPEKERDEKSSPPEPEDETTPKIIFVGEDGPKSNVPTLGRTVHNVVHQNRRIT